jgi:hypothetical protein
MKKLIDALVVIALSPIAFVSCGSRTGGAGGNPPGPQTVAAKIDLISYAPSATITYDGRQNTDTTSTIKVSASGSPVPTVTINGVSGSTYTTPVLLTDGTYEYSVSANNGIKPPAIATATVTVTTDPVVASMVSGGWKLTSKKVNGTPITFTCESDDVTTFTKNNGWITNAGTICPMPASPSIWYFLRSGTDVTIKGWGMDKKIVSINSIEWKLTAIDPVGNFDEFTYTRQ